MDIGAMTKKFDGKCDFCGKYGHKSADCWVQQSGTRTSASKGKGKSMTTNYGNANRGGGHRDYQKQQCYQCGMTNHLSKDCRASDEKKRKWQESQKGKGK